MNSFALRPGMLLGVTLTPLQHEGGSIHSAWNGWYSLGNIADGANPAVAVGHFDRWREDTLLMRSMNVRTCRIGVSWARIEPEEGVFDKSALEHLREELMLMLAVGIKPLVALFEASVPAWFDEKGGWLKEDNISCYLVYVERVVRSIGHLVNEYLTMSGANEYARRAYREGKWPPGHLSDLQYITVMSNLAAAHIRAYRLIKDVRLSLGFKNSRVSFANTLCDYEPKNEANPLHRALAKQSESLNQKAMGLSMLTGEFIAPLRRPHLIRRGIYADFHAVGYYSRRVVSVRGNQTMENSRRSDIDWEIYPQGLVKCCRQLTELVRLPIYITENGVSDTEDAFRSRFIYEHLQAICLSGLPIKRYYYRSFMDGFDYNLGASARFGLVAVDSVTKERRVKRSGEFFSRVIEENAVTQELYNEYVAGQEFKIP
ncbi:MAG: family 1 glycosylhydrolase [Oscillospiraceae bacterium]|nr:family 1 glycosylhydrolase [Oscillospiraceae bacterium]